MPINSKKEGLSKFFVCQNFELNTWNDLHFFISSFNSHRITGKLLSQLFSCHQLHCSTIKQRINMLPVGGGGGDREGGRKEVYADCFDYVLSCCDSICRLCLLLLCISYNIQCWPCSCHQHLPALPLPDTLLIQHQNFIKRKTNCLPLNFNFSLLTQRRVCISTGRSILFVWGKITQDVRIVTIFDPIDFY